MGFYIPAVLVKDAQRHGLRVRPIDIQVSDWACTIEHERDGALSLRMGLGYARGLRRQSAEAVVATRSHDGTFRSAEDLALRVPLLNRMELTLLALVGALNKLDGIEHRRDALWQVERAGKLEGPLLRRNSDWLRETSSALPLEQMNIEPGSPWENGYCERFNSKLRDEFLNGEIFLFHERDQGAGGALVRPLQHHPATFVAGLSTTGT
jgi:error-prone DNA polymerase